MTALPRKLYTLEQAGEYLIVPRQTVQKWLREGRIKGVKVGNKWRIPEEALEEFLNSGRPAEDKDMDK